MGRRGLCATANMVHIRQSRPDSGLAFQAKVLETFYVVPSTLGSITLHLDEQHRAVLRLETHEFRP